MAIPKCRGGVGFRDFEVFNQALLAKQGWRMIQNPESLCTKILKARYFPNSDFMEARMGNAPSYTWRSILHGREALEKGLVWRIGDGKSVNIWRDRWLPKNNEMRVTTLVEAHEVGVVADLIDPSSRRWRGDVIAQYFNAEDATRITEIPLARTPAQDIRAWQFENSGLFSVRSLYKFLMQQIMEGGDGHAGQHEMDEIEKLWVALWKIKAPSKMCVFLWRLAHHILPTGTQLQGKGVEVSDVCSRCDDGKENCEHALWSCPKSKLIWEEVMRRFNVTFIAPSSSDMVKWLHENLVGKPDPNKVLFTLTTWAIWVERNNVWTGKSGREARIVVDGIGRLREELMQTNASGSDAQRQGRGGGVVRWIPPDTGWIKLNSDAAFDRTREVMGLGMIARGSRGEFLFGCAKTGVGDDEVLLGEAKAFKEGLMLAHQYGYRRVIAQSDSMQLVNLVYSAESDFSPFGAIIKDIKETCRGFDNWVVSHVMREANVEAHSIAKFALNCNDVVIWQNNIPDFVVPILNLQEYQPDE